MTLTNNVEDNRRKARRVFLTVHQPLLKDVLSKHEISQLLKEDHIMLQEIGSKMHHIFINKNKTSTSILDQYATEIDQFLSEKDELFTLYLETIYNRQKIPSSINTEESKPTNSNTTKKGYLQNLLSDKPIPRKKVNNVTKNKPSHTQKWSPPKNTNHQSNSNQSTNNNTSHNNSNNRNKFRKRDNRSHNNYDNNSYNRSYGHHDHKRGKFMHHNNSHYNDRSYHLNYVANHNSHLNNHDVGAYSHHHQEYPHPSQSFQSMSYNQQQPHPYSTNNHYPTPYNYYPSTYDHQPPNVRFHGHPPNHYHNPVNDNKLYNNDSHPKINDVTINSPSVSNDKNNDVVVQQKTNHTNHNHETSSSIITKMVPKSSTLSKPIVYEKKESLNKSITKSTSYSLQKSLIDSNTITTPLLDTLVSFTDTSTTLSTDDNKTVSEQIHGHVIRCYKKDNKVYWKIELIKSRYFIVVDTQLCNHIINSTNNGEYYELSLYTRNSKDKTKIKKRKTNKSKLKPNDAYIPCIDVDLCLFCGINSRKPRNRSIKSSISDTNTITHNHSCNMLACSICSSVSCNDCLQSLLLKMDSNNEEKDKWYRQIVNFLRDGESPSDFIGHCCELKSNIEEAIDDVNSPKKITTLDTLDTKYDGCLHFPELHILLDTPYISHIDIHGLGKEQPLLGTPGLLHGVVDKACAIECHQENTMTKGTYTNLLSEYKETIEFNNVHQEKESLVCCIQIFEMDNLVQHTQLKHYHPTPELISTSTHLQMDMHNIDVWIILAKNTRTPEHCHLVNMRWKSKLDYNKWSNDINTKHLFNTIKSKCKNNGFEAKRTGGSNGFTTYKNRDIVNLLSTNTAFPRKGKGVKVVKKDKKWVCYYNGVRKKKDDTSSLPKFVSWSYTQPQIGGNFEMQSEIIHEFHDVIFAMTEIKYNSACLIGKLNILLKTNIQQFAVESAIEDMNVVRNKLIANLSIKTCSPLFKETYLHELSMQNKFTLVAYPCGYHHDIFDKRSYSLENKICFGYKNNNQTNKSIGRGGQGVHMFVYALLDWTNSSK